MRFDTGHTGQLLGEHALFQGKLFGVGQVLHAATAAAAEVRARRRTPQFAGLEHPFGARLDDFAVGAQHARFHVFAGQRAVHKPGAAFKEHDAAAVIGQALDGQALFLAYRNLRGPAAARRLEAQASLVLGHQLGSSKMPVDK
ncbi:hypothetical protein PS720_06431 [Pseudomonas fluorescens]|nr:hypothetical protein PS720_06431 [Pseudomonas fluorescens]